MARLFPVRSQFQLETFGERQFAERLEDDYLCWSNVPIGPSAGYQDFVMLQPPRGVVKGWTLSAIQSRVSTALKTENKSVPFFLVPFFLVPFFLTSALDRLLRSLGRAKACDLTKFR
jgi:hypothetical protein